MTSYLYVIGSRQPLLVDKKDAHALGIYIYGGTYFHQEGAFFIIPSSRYAL